jgi:hypothetical protein
MFPTIYIQCLSVINTIYEYLLSHLFSSIAIAPIDTCVVKFTSVFLNSIHTLVKHRDHIHNNLPSSILSNHIDLSQLSSLTHVS